MLVNIGGVHVDIRHAWLGRTLLASLSSWNSLLNSSTEGGFAVSRVLRICLSFVLRANAHLLQSCSSSAERAWVMFESECEAV